MCFPCQGKILIAVSVFALCLTKLLTRRTCSELLTKRIRLRTFPWIGFFTLCTMIVLSDTTDLPELCRHFHMWPAVDCFMADLPALWAISGILQSSTCGICCRKKGSNCKSNHKNVTVYITKKDFFFKKTNPQKHPLRNSYSTTAFCSLKGFIVCLGFFSP